jgi:hypothetical protein
MTQVLVVEHLASQAHALKIIRTLKQKRHAKFGWSFEVEELGLSLRSQDNLLDRFPQFVDAEALKKHREYWAYPNLQARTQFIRTYGEYSYFEPLYYIRVFKENGELITQDEAEARKEIGDWFQRESSLPVDRTALGKILAVFDRLSS